MGREIVEALGGESHPDRSRARLQHDQIVRRARARTEIALLRLHGDSACGTLCPIGPRAAARAPPSSAARGRAIFVEVGANRPQQDSQTWHLEQLGWTGVLIEPQPDLADDAAARDARPRCSRSPARRRRRPAGACRLHVAGAVVVARPRPAWRRVANPSGSSEVPVRTLDEHSDRSRRADAVRFPVDRCRRPRARGAAADSISRAGAAPGPARRSRRRPVRSIDF